MVSRPEVRGAARGAERRRWPVKLAIPAAAGAVALLAAGCGGATSPHTSAASRESTGGLSPVKAIALAASQAQQTTSFTSDLNARVTVSDPQLGSGATTMNITGTLASRIRPSLLLDMDMSSMTGAGMSIPGGMTMIMNGTGMYLKYVLFRQMTGKDWVEIPFSELQQSTGTNITQMLSQAQDYNPLVQTQMLTAAKNVRVVGTQLINGVETTHYTGSYPMTMGLTKLSASQRATVEQQMSKFGLQNVGFNVWIDAQHQMRKMVLSEQGSKESMNMTLTVTGVNVPVNVSVPPASQVATVPAQDLTGRS
jgi:hypothetical protein